MSEDKFTRGPWKVLPEEVDRPYIRIRGSVLGGRYKIANVVTPTYEGVHEREAIETRANAALISAAPDLYQLLAAADTLIIWESMGFTNEFADRVEAALAKARGES